MKDPVDIVPAVPAPTGNKKVKNVTPKKKK